MPDYPPDIMEKARECYDKIEELYYVPDRVDAIAFVVVAIAYVVIWFLGLA